jgi:hypothetical protein
MTVYDSLHSLLDYGCLLFCVTDLVLIYESLTSSASVVRWLTLHSWTLNSLATELRLPWTTTVLRITQSRMTAPLRLANDWLSLELTSRRTEYRSPPWTVRVLLLLFVFFSVATKRASRPATQQRRSHCWLCNLGNVFTEPLSSNCHIRHNILNRVLVRHALMSFSKRHRFFLILIVKQESSDFNVS